MIISGSFLRMTDVSDSFVDKIKTHALCSVTFSDIRAVYEIRWTDI
jgi:hypothetical protein